MPKYYRSFENGEMLEISADEYHARLWCGERVKREGAPPKINHPLKYDEGKYDPTLVEPWLIKALASVYQEGIDNKYSRGSWKKFELDKARGLIAPALRHINLYLEGEFIDPDGDNPHLAKAMWNLATVLYHEQKAR